MAQENPTYVQSIIRRTLENFKQYHVHGLNWCSGPTTRPISLITQLEACGFKHRLTQTCMILRTTSIQSTIPTPTGLKIQEVTTLEELKQKCSIEQIGFDASDGTAQDYYLTYQQTGIGPQSHLHHYIGWLHEEPVAVSALLLHKGMAGIYGITTLPDHRRQGIANAMTLYTVQEAYRLGYTFATLSPTKMSHALYRRLGFTDYCQQQHYYYIF